MVQANRRGKTSVADISCALGKSASGYPACQDATFIRSTSVGAAEKRRQVGKSQRGLQVDDRIEPARRLHGKITRLVALV
jgi:hypothetical protein